MYLFIYLDRNTSATNVKGATALLVQCPSAHQGCAWQPLTQRHSNQSQCSYYIVVDDNASKMEKLESPFVILW